MARMDTISFPLRNPGKSVFATWLFGLVSAGLLFFIVMQFALQVANPPGAARLELVQDVALPSALPAKFLPNITNVPQQLDPLAPGVAVRYDHFDFQALDPKTRLLFIAHTGPAPDKYASAVDPQFNPDKDAQVDGNVLVFDTQRNKLVGRIDIPQVAGIVAAPDLGRVFAADSNDSIVYSIDEKTLKPTAIPVGDNESPDAVEYDPDNHKIFVSDPGAPSPDNINPNNQNVSVIDTRTNKVTKINIGHLPKLSNEHAGLIKWGYDVGHNRYDPVLHRIFVTTQQLTNQSSANPPLPPPGTGELVSIDPVTEKVVSRVQLPNTCGTPHGMSIDTQQHIAFIACTDVDPDHNLVQNLVRVNVQTMKVIADPLMILALKPDIVVLDHPLHVLFVACSSGISVFDVKGGTIHRLGPDYVLGKGTHTIALDETTQHIYLPLADAGGRPVLRIVKYNPNGI